MNFLKTYDVKLGREGTVDGFLERALDESAFYAVNLGAIVEQHNTWRELLPTVRPYYAVKCNPDPAVVEMLRILGVGFDCASKDEIRLVTERGAAREDIVFANPCKAGGDIQFARAEGVDTLVFDDVHELLKIKLYHPEAKLILRIMTDDSHSACRFNAKFGAAEEDVEDLLSTAANMDLNVVGVSFHVGSRCREPRVYHEAIANARRVFDVATRLGHAVSVLDVGGGFPGDDPEAFRAAAAEINRGLADFFPGGDVRVIAEPGRYYVTASHTLVANVIGKKAASGPDGTKTFKYYLNDGVYGSFNCIVFDHSRPKIVPFTDRKDAPLYESKVFGPTCDSIDTISESCLLPELAIGEWVTVENFGAYTIAAASTFNGFQQTKCLYGIYKT